MIARRTLKRTAVGLLIATLGTLATGCDKLVDSVAKRGVLTEKPAVSLLAPFTLQTGIALDGDGIDDAIDNCPG